MSIARLRQVKDKLQEVLKELDEHRPRNRHEEAGINPNYPQTLLVEAIVLIDKETGDDK